MLLKMNWQYQVFSCVLKLINQALLVLYKFALSECRMLSFYITVDIPMPLFQIAWSIMLGENHKTVAAFVGIPRPNS